MSKTVLTWGELVYCQLKPDGYSHALQWGNWNHLGQLGGVCGSPSLPLQGPAALLGMDTKHRWAHLGLLG